MAYKKTDNHNEKGPPNWDRRAFVSDCSGSACRQFRLPNSWSSIMNMLMKFRYRLSAPMIAALPR